MKKVELLSPAGNLERLKIALTYGADAVYFGGYKYGLRSNAANFSLSDIKEAASFAHKLNKKIYLTLNIVFHNSDFKDLKEYISSVVDAGIDAFIVSSLVVIKHIKENYPEVECHLSTQNSITNYLSIKYLKTLGVDRVVLAREVGLDDIKLIRKEVPTVDLEYFIHGAMCTYISGRCALSSFFTDRDANRGACSQVCRFLFDNNGDKFTTMTSDLNLIYYIKDLIDAGVASLKVEGRMRSPYYLAIVIGTYRKLIDEYYDGTLKEEDLEKFNKDLSRVSNRPNSSQYIKGYVDKNDMYFLGGRDEKTNQDYLAMVKYYDKNKKRLYLKQRNKFNIGDKVVLFNYHLEDEITISKIYNDKDELIESANEASSDISIYYDKDINIPEYSMIRVSY